MILSIQERYKYSSYSVSSNMIFILFNFFFLGGGDICNIWLDPVSKLSLIHDTINSSLKPKPMCTLCTDQQFQEKILLLSRCVKMFL